MRGARLVRLLALLTTAFAVTVPLYAQVPAAPAFTDDPLQPGLTPIRVVHLTELRGAIDSLRARYGVPAMTWTDATLSPGVTRARAVHLTELRSALDDVYAAALRTPPVYTDSPPSAGVTVVTALHIAELRAGVLAIWNLGPPTVSSITPTVGSTAGGTMVTILGTNFVNPSVLIGGVAATSVVPVDAGTITAAAGAHAAGVVDVVVTNKDGQFATLAAGFTYGTPPTITSVEPAIGARTGQRVTIRGTNLRPSTTTVTIGSWTGTAELVGDAVGFTWITVTPSSPSTGTCDVTVTNPDGGTATRQNGYTYAEAAPRVDSVSPAQGPVTGGTAITITGAYFQSGAAVKLGGTAATGVTFVNATTLTATTPAHAVGVVDLAVTNPDSQTGTRTGAFTYGSPATDYLAFGDSLTAGLVVETAVYFDSPPPGYYVLGPATYPSPYPGTLSGLLARPVTNAGVSGENTAGGVARLPSAIAPSHGVVILLEGTNDANMMTSEDSDAERAAKADAIVNNLLAMVAEVRSQGKKALLATLPPSIPVWFAAPPYPPGDIYHGPLPWAVSMVNDRIRALVAQLSADPAYAGYIAGVDLYVAFGGDSPNPSLLCVDGLHPSVAGYGVMASTIFNALPAGWK
jgi:lysophospholipase L1-like esterase